MPSSCARATRKGETSLPRPGRARRLLRPLARPVVGDQGLLAADLLQILAGGRLGDGRLARGRPVAARVGRLLGVRHGSAALLVALVGRVLGGVALPVLLGEILGRPWRPGITLVAL